MIEETDILVIGCGIAGAVCALELAKKGLKVTLITSGEGNSHRAQGGISFQTPEGDRELFKQDILRAGAGLCNERAVDQLVTLGPESIQSILLDEVKVPFERCERGEWKLTKEAAHSRARILYHRDATGRAVMDAILKKIASMPNITLRTGQSAIDIITLSHHSLSPTDIYAQPTCVGAYLLDGEKVEALFAKETILATGGVGEVFLHTSNGVEARGDGIAMAYRAGVRIMNMEYVQFHPTTLYHLGEPRFLLTEALRGEGARVLSRDFKPFMEELAPRDRAAGAIFQEMVRTAHPHLWLDISFKERGYLRERFPTIYDHCLERGWDLTQEPIPIVPAAHYSCGGIAVDLEGRTTMKGLRAIGEVACSGVHGANRLASTALLEGLVWAKTTADSIVREWKSEAFPEVEQWQMGSEAIDEALILQDWMTIKQTMWNYVGLVRSTHRLKRAHKMLSELKEEIDSFYANALLTPELLGLRNGCETALLITQGALRNRNSRGVHQRQA